MADPRSKWAKKRKIQYVGIRVDTEEVSAWFEDQVGDLLPNVKCHHATLKFAPTIEETENFFAFFQGKEIELQVVGFHASDDIQALKVNIVIDGVVNNTVCANEIPHITIACAEGIKPSFSNEALEKACTPLDAPFYRTFKGTIMLNGRGRDCVGELPWSE